MKFGVFCIAMLSINFLLAEESSISGFNLAIEKKDVAEFRSALGEMSLEQRAEFMDLYNKSVQDYAHYNSKKEVSKASENEAIFEMRNALHDYDEQFAKLKPIYRWRMNLIALGRIIIKAIF